MILTCYDLVNHMCIHCNDADNTSSVIISKLRIVHNIVSWLRGRACINHVAQVSDTAQVTRQVSLCKNEAGK